LPVNPLTGQSPPPTRKPQSPPHPAFRHPAPSRPAHPVIPWREAEPSAGDNEPRADPASTACACRPIPARPGPPSGISDRRPDGGYL